MHICWSIVHRPDLPGAGFEITLPTADTFGGAPDLEATASTTTASPPHAETDSHSLERS